MGSFRVSKEDADRAVREHIRRRRSFTPPEINFNRMGKGPDGTIMPQFQSDKSSHAPLAPEKKND